MTDPISTRLSLSKSQYSRWYPSQRLVVILTHTAKRPVSLTQRVFSANPHITYSSPPNSLSSYKTWITSLIEKMTLGCNAAKGQSSIWCSAYSLWCWVQYLCIVSFVSHKTNNSACSRPRCEKQLTIKQTETILPKSGKTFTLDSIHKGLWRVSIWKFHSLKSVHSSPPSQTLWYTSPPFCTPDTVWLSLDANLSTLHQDLCPPIMWEQDVKLN